MQMKIYKYILFSLSIILIIAGLFTFLSIITINGTGTWFVFPSLSFSMMARQINTELNSKRGNMFWILQAMFYVGVIVGLISAFVETIFIGLALLTLSAALVFTTANKTGKIEKAFLSKNG